MAKAAIAEIKAQLQQQGGSGKVWIADWNQRYKEQFGTLRDFLDSKRDQFTLVPGGGKSFTVELARGGGGGKKGGGKKGGGGGQAILAIGNGNGKACDKGGKGCKGGGKGGGGMIKAGGGGSKGWNADPASLASEAIREITRQLKEQGGEGHVWLENWKGRFQGTLGTQKEFLESRPANFTMIFGEGRKYTVRLASKGKGKGNGKAGEKRRKGGSEIDGPPAKKRRTDQPLDEQAMEMIDKQMDKPNYSGNVWIPSWNRVFKEELGTFREFLESRPEKYVVVLTTETKFTVEKAEEA